MRYHVDRAKQKHTKLCMGRHAAVYIPISHLRMETIVQRNGQMLTRHIRSFGRIKCLKVGSSTVHTDAFPDVQNAKDHALNPDDLRCYAPCKVSKLLYLLQVTPF